MMSGTFVCNACCFFCRAFSPFSARVTSSVIWGSISSHRSALYLPTVLSSTRRNTCGGRGGEGNKFEHKDWLLVGAVLILADYPTRASYAEGRKCLSSKSAAPRMPDGGGVYINRAVKKRSGGNKKTRLTSSQQSSMAKTLSRRSGLKDDWESAQCHSEPPGKIESRVVGRTDVRDCLCGAWYDIGVEVPLRLSDPSNRANRDGARQRVGGVGANN
jgi:hypothetical protein